MDFLKVESITILLKKNPKQIVLNQYTSPAQVWLVNLVNCQYVVEIWKYTDCVSAHEHVC